MKDYWNQKRIRIGHWEYWNSSIIYFPIFPYLLFLMLKTRDLFFFISANPGIENGGFTLESKWKIQDQMSHKYFPKTILISRSNDLEQVKNQIHSFQFPLYLKPDIGGKGRGVVQIHSLEELSWYHENCPLDYLVQEKINYPKEIGVFYIKKPQEKSGYISGIVAKEYIQLIGDGIKTMEELLRENPRYFLQLARLKKENAGKLQTILKKGQVEIISEIGNHAQGSAFTDCSERINLKLTHLINELANELEGFYFGRFDIRFNSWEELERGENFAIIEVNGSGSEPTHIYDATHSLFFAWSEIMRHWKAMSVISHSVNKEQRSKISFVEGIKLLRNHTKVMKKLNHFSDAIQLGNV
ncbi:D-alanine--D-alanine ligase [Fluviicola taffensis]|uniref:D-alanine--D-alanine ligase n=1 Tax=Fluviicola taffensis TaxID=191579 RepID=UPI0031378E9F